MIKFVLPYAHLKAARLFTTRDVTRYNLTGVFVRITEKHIDIAACDGRRLFADRIEGSLVEDALPSPVVEVMIPGRAIDWLKKSPLPMVPLCLRDDGRLEIGREPALVCTPLEGLYVDYVRAIPPPNLRPPTTMTVNPDYLAAAAKAGKLLNPQYPGVHVAEADDATPEHQGALLLRYVVGTAVVVIMPIQSRVAGVATLPPWLTPPAPKVETPAETLKEVSAA